MAKKSKAKEELLELRKAIKKRKPKFIRQDAHKKDKLEEKWRKPKGLQSKMRLKKRGYRRSVVPGFKSPKEVKGLVKSGLLPVVISTTKELEKLDPKQHAIILKSSLGMKKKTAIVETAKKTGLAIENIKDVDQFLNSVKEAMEKRKKEKETKAKKKEEKLKEKKKKAEEKEKKSIEEKVETEEEKKERESNEKKKMDRLLATKQ